MMPRIAAGILLAGIVAAQDAPPDPALVSLASKCGRQVRWRKDLDGALNGGTPTRPGRGP